jgi:hypothetical protein
MTTDKATPTFACVEWVGAKDSDGYGRVMHKGKWTAAHRVKWEQRYGEVPEGMVLDHLCRVRDCINIEHLDLVTPRENTLRGNSPFIINRRKTVCSKGHPLSGENLHTDCRGFRQCRECGRIRGKLSEKEKRRPFDEYLEDVDFRRGQWPNDYYD